ncbi:MAG: SAM-dependent methyltransferase [Clostridium sp.]|nr:SAM-dependent methyltransferase [Clostridium sp.]
MTEKKFFYNINFNIERDKELCDLEMKYIFGYIPDKYRYVLSDIDTNPSRSPYIKEKISIDYWASSLEELVNKINNSKLLFENFKVIYIKSNNNDVSYEERLKAVKTVAKSISGIANIKNPEVVFGISYINSKWIFGTYEKNDCKWHNHDKRPYSYSNALTLTIAKAIVNIAIGNNYNKTLVDPCCGVGTVVVEALDLGVNIKGYEINPLIANNAKRNLEFFGFENCIEEKDMHNIKEKFDVAILDMPYDLFTSCSLLEQNNLIKSVYDIANELIIVTIKDMDEELQKVGFKIVDKCSVSKNQFKRYITVCKKDIFV